MHTCTCSSVYFYELNELVHSIVHMRLTTHMHKAGLGVTMYQPANVLANMFDFALPLITRVKIERANFHL